MVDRDPPLRIVSYSTSTVAGVPAILARCINARTKHHCRCVWARKRSNTGIEFEGDIEWNDRPDDAAQELAAADLVIVHNGHVDPAHARALATKPVVVMAHNYASNVDFTLVECGFPGAVVGQYQALQPEFQGWLVVPNPIPLWEPSHRPGKKPRTVALCYTPSGAHDQRSPDTPMYWHSKGYATTVAALRWLEGKHGVGIETAGETLVPHLEALAMKRRTHLVVDECVTGSYHRNSLEGLAAGCVVVNGVGLLPGVSTMLSYCARFAHTLPFEFSDLNNLGTILESLVEAGPDALEDAGAKNRAWMERHWDFEEQWSCYWRPLVRLALEATPS